MDNLAAMIKHSFELDPFEKDVLFLFCGRRSDRIKGLLWEGDGFLLLYKRLASGSFKWPRTQQEALSITMEQYHLLMGGFEVIARNPIRQISGPLELL